MKAINVDVGGIAGGLFDLIDKLFTTDEERSNAKLRLIELQQKGDLAQIAVNTTEAQHSSIFVAGWRPFIGWVCGTAFAWHFVLLPVVTTALVAAGIPFIPPGFDMTALMTVLGGMLGLGGLRTFEKVKGVSRETTPGAPSGKVPVQAPRIDRRASAGTDVTY